MGILRRLLQVLLLVATLLVGATAAVIIVTQTAWFKDWLRGLIVRQANDFLNGRLSIGRLGGNLFFGLEFEDLGVTQGGDRVVAVRSAGIDYSLVQFISGDIVIDHIRLDRPSVVLKREAAGWNLARLVKQQREENRRKGPGRAVTIGEVGISDGRFIVDDGSSAASGADGSDGTAGTAGRRDGGGGVRVPREISGVDARFSVAYEPVHYTVDIAHLSLRGREPDLVLNDLSGRISARDSNLFLERVAVRTAESSLRLDGEVDGYASKPVLKLEASSDKLAIPEVARLVPALAGILVQPAFRVTASGPLNAVAFDFAVRSSAGDASGQVTADLAGREHALAGEVHLKDLDLAPLVGTPAARSSLSGLARVDVRFPAAAGSGPVAGSFSVSTFSARLAGYQAQQIEARGRVDGRKVTVEQGRAVAYGARATAFGSVEPGVRGKNGTPGLAMDLHGAVSGLDLRRLPRSLKVPPFDSHLNFDYRVTGIGAAVEGEARVRVSQVGGAEVAEGTVGRFSTVGPEIEYGAEGSLAHLDVRRLGRVLRIDPLDADRFSSDLSGRFSARGRGTTAGSLTLDASAALNNSTLDRVSLPLMAIEAHLADGGGRFKVDGGFHDLDPSRFLGSAATRGNVAGRVALDAAVSRLTGPMTPDTVSASGTVTLDRSTIGGLALDRAEVSGDFSESVARIRDAVVSGPDLAVRASGHLAIGQSGDSSLAYHVESPDLAVIGKVAGQPGLQGFLSVDGRVAGNGANLRTQGDIAAGNLRYGGVEALTAKSRYDVTLPSFDAARAQVRADTTFDFVKAAGQDIAVLRASTTYGNQQVGFDVTAEQAVRSGRFVGNVVLHPDHQEVHLTRFGLNTQGLSWAIAPGAEPAVQYGGGTIAVKDVHLVSGEQSLAVEGTVGPKSSRLRAALTNVDLARLDTWLVGERRLGGTLNAAATVTGPSSALDVTGDFSVDAGAFRDFRYDTLGGSVTYARDKLALDVRLQQNPRAWIAARGTLPTALFGPTTPGGAPVPGADLPVDLTVKSSPIDLGIVQGFTGAVTKAAGTLVADLRVGGTAAKPEMSGGIDVANGAFTLEPAGVSYKALDGRIALQPNRAVIERLGVTDEHDRTLTVSGELGLQGRSLGAVKLKVSSRKFEVLHNDVGRVALNADLAVGGDLRAPQVTGQLDVDAATINIDRVLELATSSAYATTPDAAAPAETAGARPAPLTANTAGNAAASTPAPAAGGGVFDAASLNLTVKVPDDAVVKGKDIQPGNTPIGLGNVNLTLGGNVRVSKRAGGPLRLVGQVNTVRGTYDFQGRRFDIQRGGGVRLDGAVPMNPTFDIAATRLISGVEARVHVGGTMRKPELLLTSDPPLDQADILSLIIFNQPANELGEGEQVSLAQRASALATGFVAGRLADSIGKALNLDVFEIQTAPTSGGGQGATVTLGEQVGRSLFFRVVQGVGADTSSQFVLDYQLSNFLRLQTTMSQGGTATRTLMRRTEQSGADLIFFFSY
jgi:autotransporter translocation and assembly factor TamB